MKTNEKNNQANGKVNGNSNIMIVTIPKAKTEQPKAVQSKKETAPSKEEQPKPEQTKGVPTPKEANPKPTAEHNKQSSLIDLSLIDINPDNPRKESDKDSIKELADNIKYVGLLHPITVREKNGRFEIVCGYRRFTAFSLYLHDQSKIPAYVRELSDEQAHDLSLSENLQREDMQPMDVAESLKRLIDTGRYDESSLALEIGKSLPYVYNYLKLNELIPEIKTLLRQKHINASVGIVLAKFTKEMQEAIYSARLEENGTGDWINYTASYIDREARRWYTNDLVQYSFDKTECLTCPHNSNNFTLFADKNGVGSCAKSSCLKEKNEKHLFAQAKEMLKKEPKISLMQSKYGSDSTVTSKLLKHGYEGKKVERYNTNEYPTPPREPQREEYKTDKEFKTALTSYKGQKTNYDKKVAELDSLKEKGKIKVFANITDSGISLHYKESKATEEKTDAQQIEYWEQKKERNLEKGKEEKTKQIKEMLLEEKEYANIDWNAFEENLFYYYLLGTVRNSHYDIFKLERWSSAEAKIKAISKITDEQKTILRRDFIHKHLQGVYSGLETTLLEDFSKLHYTEKTAILIADIDADVEAKNDRLDEKITAQTALMKRKEDKAKEVSKEQGAKDTDIKVDAKKLKKAA